MTAMPLFMGADPRQLDITRGLSRSPAAVEDAAIGDWRYLPATELKKRDGRHKPEELPARFHNRLVVDTFGCWLWTASHNGKGYGMIFWRDQRWYTHRLAYTLLVGDIPDGLVIDHLCRRRLCANPAHMELVTPRENTQRGSNALRTHCKNGHPYDETNTYWRKNQYGRGCRACHAERQRKRSQGPRSAA